VEEAFVGKYSKFGYNNPQCAICNLPSRLARHPPWLATTIRADIESHL
jgi:hypothetical protein